MAVSLVAQSKIAIFKILKGRLNINSPKKNIREAKQYKILLCHLMALLRRAMYSLFSKGVLFPNMLTSMDQHAPQQRGATIHQFSALFPKPHEARPCTEQI